jgi:hypothetical protein
MIIDLIHLIEADRHLIEAHRRIRRQREVIAELKARGKPSHAASALLALLILMLPIVEDLRQQFLKALVSDDGLEVRRW